MMMVAVILIATIFTTVDRTWTQKDIDEGDKMYGFMCCKCEKPLEDGEGKPRLCKDCEL